MALSNHPPIVGHDDHPSSTESADQNHIPYGYAADHDAPTAFVVRCSRHGRIHFEEDRGNAHRRAGQHALACRGSAGVTPVAPVETSDDDRPGTGAGEIDPRLIDLTGTDVTVTYRSVQGSAGHQRRCVSVDEMLPAEGDYGDWRGFEATARNGASIQVLVGVEEPAVKVESSQGPRRIGALASVRPSCDAGGTAVATDGGTQ